MLALAMDINQESANTLQKCARHSSRVDSRDGRTMPSQPALDSQRAVIARHASLIEERPQMRQTGSPGNGEDTFNLCLVCPMTDRPLIRLPGQQQLDSIDQQRLPSTRLTGDDVKPVSQLPDQIVDNAKVPDPQLK